MTMAFDRVPRKPGFLQATPTQPMRFTSNPGFRSPTTHNIDFGNNIGDELQTIARSMVAKQYYMIDKICARADYFARRKTRLHLANASPLSNALLRPSQVFDTAAVAA